SRPGQGNQAEPQAPKAGKGQDRAAPVEALRRLRIAALDDMARRDQDGRQGDHWVDQEDEAPGRMVDDEAADERARRGGYGGEAGPRDDHGAAPGLVERGADDRERARDQERSADALHGAGGEQLCGARRQAAPQRRRRENGGADDEDAAAAEPITGGAADQQERAQRERIGV